MRTIIKLLQRFWQGLAGEPDPERLPAEDQANDDAKGEQP